MSLAGRTESVFAWDGTWVAEGAHRQLVKFKKKNKKIFPMLRAEAPKRLDRSPESIHQNEFIGFTDLSDAAL